MLLKDCKCNNFDECIHCPLSAFTFSRCGEGTEENTLEEIADLYVDWEKLPSFELFMYNICLDYLYSASLDNGIITINKDFLQRYHNSEKLMIKNGRN